MRALSGINPGAVIAEVTWVFDKRTTAAAVTHYVYSCEGHLLH